MAMKRSRASLTRMTKRNHQRTFPQLLRPGGAFSPPSFRAPGSRIRSGGWEALCSDMTSPKETHDGHAGKTRRVVSSHAVEDKEDDSGQDANARMPQAT